MNRKGNMDGMGRGRKTRIEKEWAKTKKKARKKNGSGVERGR